MEAFFRPMHRLHERGPTSRGLVVDVEGIALGSDCILAERTPTGYRSADPDEIARLLRAVFGRDDGADWLATRIAGITKALSAGELAKAQMLGLYLAIDELDDNRRQRLAKAAGLTKAGFDPDQARDERGRWTNGGDAGSARISGAVTAGELAAGASAGSSIFGPIGRTALAGLTELGAGIAAPIAFLGTLFIPTNRSLISEGTLPDRPGFAYRYDEDMGVLSIYRVGESAGSPLLSGHTGPDGIIRDSGGRAIGRDLGSSAIIDPDALPDIVASAQIGQRAGTGAQARSDADANEPKLCPDPGPDKPGGRKEGDIAYQMYVSALVNPTRPLPAGLAVKLRNPITGKDVYFDDCRLEDGTMVDAKGNYLPMLQRNSVMPWKNVENEMFGQAEKQLQAAGKRRIEWHFAQKEVAEHIRDLFDKKDINITVIYSPPPWKIWKINGDSSMRGSIA